MTRPSASTSRRPRNDEGASLLIVLVIVAVLGVVLAALTSFGATAELGTISLNDQAKTTYTTGSALDAAINAAAQNPTLGVDSGTGQCWTGSDLTIPSSAGVNGLQAVVQCKPWTDSGKVTPGNGVGDNNSPRYAVLTLPQASDDGFRQESNKDLKVNGKMYLGGHLFMGGSGATLTVTDDLKAHGTCDAGVTVLPPGTQTCDASTVPYPTDPQSDSDATYAATWIMPSVNATATPQSVPSSCSPVTHVVVLTPGRYTDAAGLSGLTGGNCNNGIVYFSPGNYYFDFNNNSDTWTVNQNSTAIVGGLISGWTPLVNPVSAYDGTTATCAGNDVNQLANSGVAFVFAGDSRMNITADASIQLCSQPSSTHQEIAVWGVKQTTTIPAQTLTDQRYNAGAATSVTGASDTTSFANPTSATGAPDGSTADVTLTSTTTVAASATLHASTYNSTDIPANATITGVHARVVHSEAGSNPDLNKFHFSLASGSTTDTTSATTAAALHPDTFTLAVADFNTPAKRAAATIDVHVSEDKANGGSTSTRSVTEHVDAVQLVFDYTIPAVPGLTGPEGTCIVASTPCPLIGTSGANAQQIRIHGTIYAPKAFVQLHLTQKAGQTIDRGVVARTVTANITPASGFTGALFGLPDKVTVTITNPRKMTFTVVIGGHAVGTAVVEFVGSNPAKIVSWDVAHCGSTGC